MVLAAWVGEVREGDVVKLSVVNQVRRRGGEGEGEGGGGEGVREEVTLRQHLDTTKGSWRMAPGVSAESRRTRGGTTSVSLPGPWRAGRSEIKVSPIPRCKQRGVNSLQDDRCLQSAGYYSFLCRFSPLSSPKEKQPFPATWQKKRPIQRPGMGRESPFHTPLVGNFSSILRQEFPQIPSMGNEGSICMTGQCDGGPRASEAP
ncbi:hypothetical protein NQZ68_037838 [Dissostichus eleginoides]|nr:hypothetical protein NQZ68_037838 [Dissostichus eleginoides]